VLTLTGVTVAYGPVQALRGVSLHVDAGEVVALLGANGAGKSTLLRAVSRLVPLSGGAITFDGTDLSRFKPHEVLGLGIAHCPEGRRIFPELTVAENLMLGAHTVKDPAVVARNLDRAFHYFPVLADRREQQGGTLSGGEQQMLAVVRALMTSPKLLLLDEPSLGLAPKLTDQIFAIIRQINREEHITVFLVEQNANEALLYANRAYVLEQGRCTMEGPAPVLRRDERVIKAYLGM
jgi:branched-chain amino acid transport system ATP-binding protein